MRGLYSTCHPGHEHSTCTISLIRGLDQTLQDLALFSYPMICRTRRDLGNFLVLSICHSLFKYPIPWCKHNTNYNYDCSNILGVYSHLYINYPKIFIYLSPSRGRMNIHNTIDMCEQKCILQLNQFHN